MIDFVIALQLLAFFFFSLEKHIVYLSELDVVGLAKKTMRVRMSPPPSLTELPIKEAPQQQLGLQIHGGKFRQGEFVQAGKIRSDLKYHVNQEEI